MTNELKKNKELSQLIKTLELIGVSNYTILDQDGESPDLLMVIENTTIGVEITSVFRNFVNGNSAKTQSDLPKIVEDSVQEYNKNKGIPLTFGFGFHGKVSINNRKNFSIELGRSLAAYMADHPPQPNHSIIEIDISGFEIEGIDFLSHIFAERNNAQEAFGFTTSAFDLAEVSQSIIEEAIRKKEQLIESYKQRCEIIWLIVTLPSMKLAADFKLGCNQKYEISHAFDEVYILDEYRKNVRKI